MDKDLGDRRHKAARYGCLLRRGRGRLEDPFETIKRGINTEEAKVRAGDVAESLGKQEDLGRQHTQLRD